jgi:phasin family protein
MADNFADHPAPDATPDAHDPAPDMKATSAIKHAVAANQAAATATAEAAKAHMTEAASKATSALKQAATASEDAARRAQHTASSFVTAAAEKQQTMFTDMTRLFKDMRFPSMVPDSSALMAAHRRNMEALSAANRMALEGAQAVARRHMEIMQSTMSELSEHVRELAGTDTPAHKAAKQAELVKKSYERAVANIRELSDLIQRSNGEAIGLLNERFKEAMDEVKELIEKTGEHTH